MGWDLKEPPNFTINDLITNTLGLLHAFANFKSTYNFNIEAGMAYGKEGGLNKQ